MYSVTATDDSGHRGELATTAARASASTTVTVTPTCAADGGVATTVQEVCRAQWTASPAQIDIEDDVPHYWVPKPVVGVDPAGNVVVLMTYAGPVTDADAGVTALPYSTALLKFDSGCHPLWTKVFTPQEPLGGVGSGLLEHANLAFDASSNIFFSATLEGTVDLGSGAVGQIGPSQIVAKLDPSGNGVWVHNFVNVVSAIWGTLAVDAADDVFLYMSALNGSDFGGGPLAIPLTGTQPVVVQLSPGGTYVSSRALASTASVFSVAGGGSQPVALAGFGFSGVTWLGGPTTALPASGSPFVGSFDARGTFAYGVPVPLTPASAMADHFLNATAKVGSRNDVFLMYGWTDVEADAGAPDASGGIFTADGVGSHVSESLAMVTPAGQVAWQDDTDFVRQLPSPFFLVSGATELFAVDPAENALVGNDVMGPNGWDLGIREVDSAGHLRGSGTWGGAGTEHLLAMTADAQGHSVVVGTTASEVTLAPMTLFVAKLGF